MCHKQPLAVSDTARRLCPAQNTRLFQLIALGIALVGFWMQLRGAIMNCHIRAATPMQYALLPHDQQFYHIVYFMPDQVALGSHSRSTSSSSLLLSPSISYSILSALVRHEHRHHGEA